MINCLLFSVNSQTSCLHTADSVFFFFFFLGPCRLVFASVMYMNLLKSDMTKLSLLYYFCNIWVIRIKVKKSSQLDSELSENIVMPSTKHQSLKRIFFFFFWSLFFVLGRV